MGVDHASKLRSLLTRLTEDAEPMATPDRPRFMRAPGEPMADEITDEFVWSFLVWEAGERRAGAMVAKVCEHVVDFNELRVCLADELSSCFGSNYPRAVERAERLRASLNDIFRREHDVVLGSLALMTKREAKAYLESLDGIPGYVAARTMLVGLGGHAVPLDDRLHRLLSRHEAVPAGLSLAQAESWLERQIRSAESRGVFELLERWACDEAATRAGLGKGEKKSASKSVPKQAKGGKG